MTPGPLDPLGFAAVVWGTAALVLCVFAYEVYVLARDVGLGPFSGGTTE